MPSEGVLTRFGGSFGLLAKSTVISPSFTTCETGRLAQLRGAFLETFEAKVGFVLHINTSKYASVKSKKGVQKLTSLEGVRFCK